MSRFKGGPAPWFRSDGPAFWVGWVPWWRPVPLHPMGKDRIGWVWRQRAALVRNLHSGWVAFVEDQTDENLAPRCKCCGRKKEDS